jgi:hypothetical protein
MASRIVSAVDFEVLAASFMSGFLVGEKVRGQRVAGWPRRNRESRECLLDQAEPSRTDAAELHPAHFGGDMLERVAAVGADHQNRPTISIASSKSMRFMCGQIWAITPDTARS